MMTKGSDSMNSLISGVLASTNMEVDYRLSKALDTSTARELYVPARELLDNGKPLNQEELSRVWPEYALKGSDWTTEVIRVVTVGYLIDNAYPLAIERVQTTGKLPTLEELREEFPHVQETTLKGAFKFLKDRLETVHRRRKEMLGKVVQELLQMMRGDVPRRNMVDDRPANERAADWPSDALSQDGTMRFYCGFYEDDQMLKDLERQLLETLSTARKILSMFPTKAD